MVNVAALRRSHGARMRRAVHNNLNNRRNSHRGYPDLFYTHCIPKFGCLDAVTHFPNRQRDITFRFTVNRIDDNANGPIVTLGDQGYIGFVNGEIAVLTGGAPATLITAPFVGAPRSEAEVVVALRPQIGEVRIWVDSEAPTVAQCVETWPYEWATSGDVCYQNSGGVTPPTPALVESILCRAARWTNFTPDFNIFQDNRDTTAYDDTLCHAAQWANEIERFIYLGPDGTIPSPDGAVAVSHSLFIADGSVPWHCDKACDPFPTTPDELLCAAAQWANHATSRVIFMECP